MRSIAHSLSVGRREPTVSEEKYLVTRVLHIYSGLHDTNVRFHTHNNNVFFIVFTQYIAKVCSFNALKWVFSTTRPASIMSCKALTV